MHICEWGPHLIATSGNSLIVYDTKTGQDQVVNIPAPNLPSNLTKGQLTVLNKEDRTINSVGVSQDGKYLALSTENKQLVVYDENFAIIKNIVLNRAASKILFSMRNEILVSDKTGDVFLYKLEDEKCEPMLLLGHLSMVLDMVLSDCGKYIITCDRDEKIRVSSFPNTYNIVSYCLGHEEFVSCIQIVNGVLLSVSGDGTIRFWEYTTGKQLGLINTNDYISEKEHLRKFSEDMDVEKVDVTALPIANMQTYNTETNLFIAVSIYNYGLQLYKTDLHNFETTILKTFNYVTDLYSFYLRENLLILDSSQLTVFNLAKEDYIDCAELTQFHKKHQNTFKLSDNNLITVLYKRKFDNVKEYLERKKIRLELNQ